MPVWVVQIFSSNYQAFSANPLLFVLALIAGAALGYIFSKQIHKGKMDALEERIKLKAEQIEVKDKTIESMSADRVKVEQVSSIVTPPPIEPNRSHGDPRFVATNARITQETENRLRELLLNGRFKFVFNPATGNSKSLTFLPSGDIGDGRNPNENRWRIVDGRLEILNSDGALYSRFVLLDDNSSLHHTNDPDTKSLRGQYMKREGRFALKRDARTGQFVDRS